MPVSRPKVICCGSAVLDHVFAVAAIPTQPNKVPASRYHQSGGGMAATAAVAIAALGGAATFWGALGNDSSGSALMSLLADAEVDVAAVLRDDLATTPVSSVLIDDAGERLLAFYPGNRPAGSEAALPLDAVAGARCVLADVRWLDGALATLKAAGLRGVPRVLDVDIAQDARLVELIAHADHALFSRGQLAAIAGVDDPRAGLRHVSALTKGLVGVTLGGEGYAWLERDEFKHEPGFAVTVRNTNGAGDTFHGAYALAIAEGQSASAAARFANAAAAVKCAKGGGWEGMPARAEVERLLTERPL